MATFPRSSTEERELGRRRPPLGCLALGMGASDPPAVPGPPPIGDLELVRAGKRDGPNLPSVGDRGSIEMDHIRPDPPGLQKRGRGARANMGHRGAKDDMKVVHSLACSIDKGFLEGAHPPSYELRRLSPSEVGAVLGNLFTAIRTVHVPL